MKDFTNFLQQLDRPSELCVPESVVKEKHLKKKNRDPMEKGRKKLKVMNVPEEQPDNIKCTDCGKVIKFKRNLARHMSLAHGANQNVIDESASKEQVNAERFSCEFCDTVVSSQYHLDRHLKSRNCSKNLLHKCKYCKEKFMSEEKLVTHETKNCVKKYMCTHCFTYFKVKKEYLAHLRSHSAMENEA